MIFTIEIKTSDFKKKSGKSPVNNLSFSILNRVFIFLNIFSLFLAFLYGLGNFQSFLDSTQAFILQILEYSVLISGIMGAYNLAALVIITIKNKQSHILRFIFITILIIINFSLFLSLKLMSSWFKL